ncbi:ABC transporter permease [Roseibium sp. CAU 1637]|uniref:ABC transporter permease n=1 Tax=Roseibium limicola TaxID=2816037 RepID=A0A939EKW5_9HYPH|nr:ABC transporter permease [Roseibium limicola]MBO0344338.1 ABC transporter permease [Roseibium limicola]
MTIFLLRRLGQSLVALFGVMTLVFFIQRLTGDPTYLLVPETATQADIEAMRHALGLDRALVVQYVDFLWDTLRFDFGKSFIQNVPVTTIIASRLPYTLQLAGGALLVAIAIGLPVGLLLALARKQRWTNILMGVVLAAQSMPTFWSGILMILLFGVGLGWLPPSGSGSFAHLIMPSIALGLLSMATYARITRSSVLDELSKDYIRSAKARGVKTGRLVTRHLLRNSAIPVISITALEISQLLAGAVIVETVFAWPGLGLLTVQSVVSRDFVVVQGVVLLGALVTIMMNFLADILYSFVDPRIRLDGVSG